MIPRRCHACRKPTLGCVTGGTCSDCGAPDTHTAKFWFPEGEQPHYRSMGIDLSFDPDRALGQLDSLRRGIAASLGPSDLTDMSPMRDAAEKLRGRRVRLVVALEVLD